MIESNKYRLYIPIILFDVFSFTVFHGNSQFLEKEDLYGKWRILGSFRDGIQTLTALKDTIRNPKRYYFYFNVDGTYTSDVVSLKLGFKGNIMKGKWMLDTANTAIIKIRILDREEKKNIPKQWVRTEENGTFTLVPVMYPIVELSRKRLVLYDKQHRTYDIYIRE